MACIILYSYYVTRLLKCYQALYLKWNSFLHSHERKRRSGMHCHIHVTNWHPLAFWLLVIRFKILIILRKTILQTPKHLQKHANWQMENSRGRPHHNWGLTVNNFNLHQSTRWEWMYKHLVWRLMESTSIILSRTTMLVWHEVSFIQQVVFVFTPT